MLRKIKTKTRFIIQYILILTVLFSFGYLGFTINYNNIKLEENKLLSDLEESLLLYGDWIVRNQTEKGDFNYELDVQTGEVLDSYNIFRQAGTLYSLCHIYEYTKDPKYRESIEEGIVFFENFFKQVDDEVSTLKISYKGQSKINTVALFLLALVEYMENNDEARIEYMDTANALANYLLYTQTSKGGFWQFGDIKEEADYYNGQPFYALIRMYKVSGDERYLEGAIKAGEYIIDRYSREEFNHGVYAWAMAGFAHLYSVNGEQKYWDFMKLYTNQFFDSSGNDTLKYFKGKTNNEEPNASLGVYLEGIAYVAWIAKQLDSEYYLDLIYFLEESLKHLMTLQIDGPRSTRTSKYILISGGICDDYECATQTIDTTQHNLSAIYLYFRYAR